MLLSRSFHFMFIFLVCFFKYHSANNEAIIIKNIFSTYGLAHGYSVVNFYCSKDYSINFMKILSKSGFYVTSVNENSLHIPFFLPHNKLIYVINLSCNKSLDILTKANSLSLFATPYRWIFTNILNYTNEYFINLDILADSDVTLVPNFETINDFVTIFKIYKIKSELKLIYEYFATWSKEGGLILSQDFEMDTAIRRRNLRKTILNTCIVITHNNSLNHLLDKREKHIDTIAKVNYIFMLHMGDMLNATMNYSVEPTWGYVDNNSNWNGMIGELTKGKSDIGGTPLFLTSDRVPIIDYIAMTTPTRSKFIFRQPKLSYITNVFTLPFNRFVWYASFALVIIITLSLFFVIKWEWFKKRRYHVDKKSQHESENELPDSFLEVLTLSLGAVCQQGASSVPYDVYGRIITILLFTSFMFLYASYSANIVALLQSSSTSIQTLDDLLHSRLDIGVDDTVFNRFYFPIFKNASEPTRRALYLQKVAPPGQSPKYYEIQEGIRRMRNGLFAFHVETGAGYKIVGETFKEDEKCGLAEIQFLQVPDPWLAVQKNSSFKEMLKIGLRKLQESGLQEREVSLLYTKRPQCMSRGNSFIGVSMVDCYPAVAILVLGVVSSLGIFLAELMIYHYIRRKNIKIKVILHK